MGVNSFIFPITFSWITNFCFLSFDNDLLEDARNFTNNIITEDPKLEKNNGKKLKNLLYIHERDAAIKTLIAG